MILGIAIGMVIQGLWITLIVGLKPEWFCCSERARIAELEALHGEHEENHHA